LFLGVLIASISFQVSTSFTFSASGVSTNILDEAWSRYKPLIFPLAAPQPTEKVLNCLTITVATASEELSVSTDESYTLDVVTPCATVKAKTVYGALHAIETFSQVPSFAPPLSHMHGTALRLSSTTSRLRHIRPRVPPSLIRLVFTGAVCVALCLHLPRACARSGRR